MTRLPVPILALLLITPGCVGGESAPPAPARPEAPVAVPPPAPVPDEDRARPAALRLDGTPRQGGVMLGQLPRGARALTLDGKAVPFDGEGRFLIAFDRDAPAAATLALRFADGRAESRGLAVAPGDWRIEHVNASPTGGAATSEEFRRRRADELARIAAARAVAHESDGWRQRFIWPVKARISGRFGAQRVYRGEPGAYHSGLDIAGGSGTPYVAPADGVVVLAVTSPFTLEGNLLIVDHGMGLNSAFLHAQTLLVKQGDMVKQGQPLGLIGATGRVSGPHLHWSMKWNDARIDPLLLLPSM